MQKIPLFFEVRSIACRAHSNNCNAIIFRDLAEHVEILCYEETVAFTIASGAFRTSVSPISVCVNANKGRSPIQVALFRHCLPLRRPIEIRSELVEL